MSELVSSKSNTEINAAIESVLIEGDLSKLNNQQRLDFYKKTCDSLGLNYLTQPFAYIKLNGKLCLYARKECTEQLRFIHKVSIYKMEKETIDGVYVVTAYARTADGKEDVSTGAVAIGNLKGEALANSFLKAETKSKRRVTLSICGLGMLDETEVSSIPNAPLVNVDFETGEVINDKQQKAIPSREELIKDISTAKSLNDLKNSYAKAYTAYAGNLEQMQDITQAKDLRKAWLEAALPNQEATLL